MIVVVDILLLIVIASWGGLRICNSNTYILYCTIDAVSCMYRIRNLSVTTVSEKCQVQVANANGNARSRKETLPSVPLQLLTKTRTTTTTRTTTRTTQLELELQLQT